MMRSFVILVAAAATISVRAEVPLPAERSPEGDPPSDQGAAANDGRDLAAEVKADQGQDEKPTPSPAQTFDASVSTSTAGTSVRLIPPDALQIVARWRARNVPEHSIVRAVWIAEDTGGTAAPDYHVDEAHAEVPGTGGTGAFTLSRPPDGWAEGRYRVEFYLNDNLAATIKLTIGEKISLP